MEDYPLDSESRNLTREAVRRHYEHQISLVKQAIQLCRDVWETRETFGKAERFLDIVQEIILNAKIDRRDDREIVHFYSRELPTQARIHCDINYISAILHYPSAIIRVEIVLGKNNDIYVDVSDL